MTDSNARLQICEEIGLSGVFDQYGKSYFDVKQFRCEFFATAESYLLGFGTDYVLREFKVAKFHPRLTERKPISVIKKEYVFPCLLREDHTSLLFFFFVSKLYNAANGLSAHRFLFPQKYFSLNNDVMLVEGSSRTYMKPGFNVELHYLELRKNYQPSMWICSSIGSI